MSPTLEELESTFPGKGKEISDLLEKRVLPTSYVSVLQYINRKEAPPPHCNLLLVAIAEVVSADTYAWFDGPHYFGFTKDGNKFVWNFALNTVVFTAKGS